MWDNEFGLVFVMDTILEVSPLSLCVCVCVHVSEVSVEEQSGVSPH